jgi:hypothetical protein
MSGDKIPDLTAMKIASICLRIGDAASREYSNALLSLEQHDTQQVYARTNSHLPLTSMKEWLLLLSEWQRFVSW